MFWSNWKFYMYTWTYWVQSVKEKHSSDEVKSDGKSNKNEETEKIYNQTIISGFYRKNGLKNRWKTVMKQFCSPCFLLCTKKFITTLIYSTRGFTLIIFTKLDLNVLTNSQFWIFQRFKDWRLVTRAFWWLCSL